MKKSKRLFLVALLFVIKVAFAQYGTLDASFDGDGKVFPVFGGLESENHFLVIQPDGKIITGETVSQHGANAQIYLIRYNLDGSHDASFGNDGVVICDFPGFTARILEIKIQSDNKIIIGGYVKTSGDYYNRSLLTRYETEGELDTSFGNNGTIIKPDNTINSIALQSDDKILVVERSYNIQNSNWDANLLKYKSNGILDTGFGTNGYVALNYGNEIVLQADGKILLAGSVSNGDFVDFVCSRYSNEGILDMSFGINGVVTIDIDDIDEFGAGIIQSDGKIVFVGKTTHMDESFNYVSTYRLIRLFSDGDLDTDFGKLGVTELQIRSVSLAVQFDEKIICVGGTLPVPDGPNEIALSRFLPNGDPDTTFGTDGTVVTSLGEIRGSASSVALTPDRKIVVGGTFCEGYLSCHPHSFIMRYTSGLLKNAEFGTSENTFLVHPNPVNQTVNLDFNLKQSEVLSIDLYDSNGRKISNLLQNVTFQTGHNSQKVELPETLSKGVYFLNVSNGSIVSNLRIVKL